VRKAGDDEVGEVVVALEESGRSKERQAESCSGWTESLLGRQERAWN
jgi:hypothetical protein